MKKKNLWLFLAVLLVVSCSGIKPTSSSSDLKFSSLAPSWDEGVPLGNATVGALVWQRDFALRFSLDRVDLWDLRPNWDKVDPEKYTYSWLLRMVDEGRNDELQSTLRGEGKMAEPSKISCAALEFPLSELGEVDDVSLFLKDAMCQVCWKNGARLQTFVHASEPIGWFRFTGITQKDFVPQLCPPAYNTPTDGHADQSLQQLMALGYEKGTIEQDDHHILYHQKGWGGFYYDVAICWKQSGSTLEGVWSVTSSFIQDQALAKAQEALRRGMETDFLAHHAYWDFYWAQSSVSLPDSVLQKQYDNEMYKFGSASREDSYPISLQAVWTADNGQLPPWHGDYHNDLNTQLSYWPAYTGNHLSEGMAYLNTLWNQLDTYRNYTKTFFQTDGIIIPGVATLTGEHLGGWVQYTLSPTVAAWMSQHFYLHWKYSCDDDFLRQRAYPFMKEVATALEQVTEVRKDGTRTLHTSASPEIFNNSDKAWFREITNFDLSLIRFAFGAATEMAEYQNLQEESNHWKECLDQLPPFDLDEDGALTIAPGLPYQESHRHFSHALAIHPLGLIDVSQGEEAKKIVDATIKKLDDYGSAWFCGYSFSWLGNLKARAHDGEGAAEALRTFAQCFCLPNTFHANGDQTKSGKSNFTYRPFTLEGNFAFASGIQDMLLQSHAGFVEVFPAIPADWKDVSFNNLRAQGAFLVSARKEGGVIKEVTVFSEKGGHLRLLLPGESQPREYEMKAGERISFNG